MVVLAVLALLVALLALGSAAYAARLARGPRRPAGDPEALPEDVLGLRQEVAALRAEAAGSLRHLGVVRYDAFGSGGGGGSSAGGSGGAGVVGGLSWSLALLDDAGDGVVLTAIHGRSEARSYAKSITAWRCAHPLSPEEREAVSTARP